MTQNALIDQFISEISGQHNPNENPGDFFDALVSTLFENFNDEFEMLFDTSLANKPLSPKIVNIVETTLNADNGLVVFDIPSTPILKTAFTENRANIQFCLVPSKNFPTRYFNLFAEILKNGLSLVGYNYLKFATTYEEVLTLAGDLEICQLARVISYGPNDPLPSPIIMEGSSAWDNNPKLRERFKKNICLRYVPAGKTPDEIPCQVDDVDYYEYLDSIIQFPDSINTWMFSWAASPQDSISMVDLSTLDSNTVASLFSGSNNVLDGHTKKINHLEILVNKTYTPHFFVANNFLKVTEAKLGALSKSIRRGTSFSRKKLALSGNISFNHVALAPMWNYPRSTQKNDQYSYYVDNLNTKRDQYPNVYVIDPMPKGQERCTVFPEDGSVILISRNGKSISLFNAIGPTLISNNNFIIKLDEALVSAEYVYCYLLGDYANRFLAQRKNLISKKELDQISIPIIDKKIQHSLVMKHKENLRKLSEARMRVSRLEFADSFNVVEVLNPSASIK